MRSVRNIAHPEELPKLGTKEAAVESCASLIAGMAGQPEAIMHYWLDLYYQVRLAYEQENGDEAPVLIRAEDLLPALRQLWKETLVATTAEGDIQDAEEETSSAETPAEGESTAAGEEDGANRSAPPGEPPGEMSGAEPVAQNRPGQPGNHSSADAAIFKRVTLERLQKLRAGGLTIGVLSEFSEGKLTSDQIMSILERKRVPIADYRALAMVLDEHFPATR